jgi:hypothetical protein
MAKYAALTVRKLKPGSYEDWRQAWEGDEFPEGVQAYILRNLNDPDEIIAFGLTERDPESFMGEDMRQAEEARQAAMAPHIESTGADGIYEIIDEISS